MAKDQPKPHDVQGPLDLARWIADNAAAFRPPVANKVVFPGSELIFMVVRGPNARNDFHINPGDEIFYQLEGTIAVDIRHEDGRIERRVVGAGEVMLVTAGVAHSPRRPADTWGVVLERRRLTGEIDQIAWFCEHCGNELRRAPFQLADIETELAALIADFNADAEARRCKRCGTVLPVAAEFVL
ncbi:MAG: 3-hydroxyanthranilate 3,4-dioxygenase [Acidimicrobiales bacterium]